MMHTRLPKRWGYPAAWAWICAVGFVPVWAQAPSASSIKKSASADTTALLQAQAIADAAKRAAKAREQAALTIKAHVESATQAPAGLSPAAPLPGQMHPHSRDELTIAQQIHRGLLRCEMGTSVHVEADAHRPGFFHVHGKGFRYTMYPVPTSTGALRLEDKTAGAVWLQLTNKSMLMDQKKGRRMADECAHPDQLAFVQATQNQAPVDLFDTTGMGRPLD